MNKGFVFSGALSAVEAFESALHWRDRAQEMRRLGDADYFHKLMGFAFERIDAFHQLKSEAIVNGYDWSRAHAYLVRVLRQRARLHEKQGTMEMDVPEISATVGHVAGGTDRVVGLGALQQVRQHQSRPLSAVDTAP